MFLAAFLPLSNFLMDQSLSIQIVNPDANPNNAVIQNINTIAIKASRVKHEQLKGNFTLALKQKLHTLKSL